MIYKKAKRTDVKQGKNHMELDPERIGRIGMKGKTVFCSQHSVLPSKRTSSKFSLDFLSIFSRFSLQAAFTLVEMLVAVALGVIILAVAVTAFQQGGAVSRVSHAKTEAVHNARVALQMLERDLEQAYLEPTGEKFVGIDSVWTWDGKNYHDDELILLSLSEQGGTSPGTPVIYSLNSNLTGIKTLQREDLPCLARSYWDESASPPDWSDGSSVGDGVRSFNVRYYYDGDWYDRWDSTDPDGADGSSPEQYRRLPEVVEVTIEVIDSDGVLAKEDQNAVQIRRLIELPQ
jgi:type II secretion system protein J